MTQTATPRTSIDPAARAQHLRWLAELTQLPTAAGKEGPVVDWIRAWVGQRSDLVLREDRFGNLTISFKDEPAGRPVYFTAHMDHPAFVVEKEIGPALFELSFRGGVMDEYFENAEVDIHTAEGVVPVMLLSRISPGDPGAAKPFKRYSAAVAPEHAHKVRPGDVAVWRIGPARIENGNFYTLACDDLAALAAAVAALDVLRGRERTQPVRVLLTRAEEIGFVGAIAACREGTVPKDARVIALENSRSFAESPIGGGPIVRVGDRLSVFTPGLTDAVAARAEEIAGGASTVTATQKASDLPAWKWQRKLMAGGACEASVFCHAGYEATCVCLPLGNYHNMADLAAVQAGTNTQKPRIGPEYIAVADYEGLVDLLTACGEKLGERTPLTPRLEKLWSELSYVLGR